MLFSFHQTVSLLLLNSTMGLQQREAVLPGMSFSIIRGECPRSDDFILLGHCQFPLPTHQRHTQVLQNHTRILHLDRSLVIW
jgi:hypothetical protein